MSYDVSMHFALGLQIFGVMFPRGRSGRQSRVNRAQFPVKELIGSRFWPLKEIKIEGNVRTRMDPQ
ncbi:hypothetical protein Mapa_011254 [Marchantia paleacea]|nr:hypothetical protein Mapa_011254 [Marchantia paleacea]